MKKLVFLIATTLILTGCTVNNVNNNSQALPYGTSTTSTNPPAAQGKTNLSRGAVLGTAELQGKKATVKTAKGEIVIELYGDVAPQTVSNFIQLSQSGFYNGLVFHRREEGFVIQGGDPAGNGTGGPGYTVPAEISEKSHIRGAVAMARLPDYINPEKESSGSQFYITLAPATFLDGEYTVFGQVTSGMAVADQIEVGDEIISITIQ
ncbi:MAG: peptidylprolyl isomerase [Candidatus Doudnabacteria bacterium]|nr:peptidylprolyl isomerase [Candidatus Doudnabacteria bacterium]